MNQTAKLKGGLKWRSMSADMPEIGEFVCVKEVNGRISIDRTQEVWIEENEKTVKWENDYVEGWMRLSELGKLATWHPVIDSAIHDNGPFVAPPRAIAWPPGTESMPNDGERVLVMLASPFTNQPSREPWLATIDMGGNELLTFACDYDPGTTDIVTHWAYLPA